MDHAFRGCLDADCQAAARPGSDPDPRPTKSNPGVAACADSFARTASKQAQALIRLLVRGAPQPHSTSADTSDQSAGPLQVNFPSSSSPTRGPEPGGQN